MKIAFLKNALWLDQAVFLCSHSLHVHEEEEDLSFLKSTAAASVKPPSTRAGRARARSACLKETATAQRNPPPPVKNQVHFLGSKTHCIIRAFI